MNRMTPADRDRAVRAVSLLTGGLAVAALGGTGVATALAAHSTALHRAARTAAKVAAEQAPAPTAPRPARPVTSRTHRLTGAGTRPSSAATARPSVKPRPKPHRTVAQAPPPTTSSGS